ncbi:MAG: bifunctional riboflavin kinase/FAD synthetase [Hahellaceae bacterium]|nr:bifunctional riboflavin kinase/FAD synthetase [Hahellaceae bacterium]MCP5170027.1 bifunctional riboflavin kinase/FAD synthetase [Hahellaceae bacterium]
MRLIRGLHNLRAMPEGCVATIGNFDGVHKGHQVIIEQVKRKARELELPSVVMVFEPQPQEYFRGAQAPARLMRFREKLLALADQDIDLLICLQFNHRVRKLTATDFVNQVLVSGLGVKHLVVGDDFRFGCDRSGDFHLLEQQGQLQGFGVEHTQTVGFVQAGDAGKEAADALNEARISSTRIRQALEANDFTLAEALLGRPYAISGCVIHGQKLGRQLGVPTANIALGRLRPALNGVYAVKVFRCKACLGEAGDVNETVDLDGWYGVANIGVKPTINGSTPSLEVHIFNFAGELYGEHLRVVFCQRLREEQKFSGLDALKAQIATDINQAKSYFGVL